MQRYYIWKEYHRTQAEMCESDDGDYVLYTDAHSRILSLEAALHFYANPEHWKRGLDGSGSVIECDYGAAARKLLPPEEG